MPSIDFSELRATVTISQVLELLSFEPRARSGPQMRGPCPIHGSTSKTSRMFSVNTERNTFQCFKCGAKGNQLDLWAQVHKLNVYDAAIDLCRRLGAELPLLS